MSSEFPWQSVYLVYLCNPVYFVDPLGLSAGGPGGMNPDLKDNESSIKPNDGGKIIPRQEDLDDPSTERWGSLNYYLKFDDETFKYLRLLVNNVFDDDILFKNPNGNVCIPIGFSPSHYSDCARYLVAENLLILFSTEIPINMQQAKRADAIPDQFIPTTFESKKLNGAAIPYYVVGKTASKVEVYLVSDAYRYFIFYGPDGQTMYKEYLLSEGELCIVAAHEILGHTVWHIIMEQGGIPPNLDAYTDANNKFTEDFENAARTVFYYGTYTRKEARRNGGSARKGDPKPIGGQAVPHK